MVNVCTRNGSNGGSSGFKGRKEENGTLTCQLQKKGAKNKNSNLHPKRKKMATIMVAPKEPKLSDQGMINLYPTKSYFRANPCKVQFALSCIS